MLPSWSGRRGSNSRPLAWKANALSTELLPQKQTASERLIVVQRRLQPRPVRHKWEEMDSNHRRRTPADLQSAPFGHSGIFPIFFNNWTLPFQSSLLCDFGADGGIRTHDPEITNHVLWPTELHRHFNRLRDAKVGIFFIFANFSGIFFHSPLNFSLQSPTSACSKNGDRPQ